MAEVDADIWILTETRASITPAQGYHGRHCPPHPARRPDADERWVSIWSRWPLRASGVPPDPRGAVSAVVESPDGDLVIYGTVLPWANEKGDDGRARMWQVHYEQIGRQVTEWQALRGLHPDAPLVVAGDFNQDRDGSGWYGTRHGRDLLTRALDDAGLTCVTDEDVVATGKLRASHLVDHIAICDRWANTPDVHLTCWEKTDHDGTHLSDHPTVAIDLMPLLSQHRQPQSSTRRRTTPSTHRELLHRGNQMRSREPAGPWPSKFPVLEGGSVTEGLPVWSLNAHIEGRTTGARLPCLTTACPGWLIGVRWETGQLMRICSEGWTYNPEHQTVRVTGGGEI